LNVLLIVLHFLNFDKWLFFLGLRDLTLFGYDLMRISFPKLRQSSVILGYLLVLLVSFCLLDLIELCTFGNEPFLVLLNFLKVHRLV
jgi:hypothetical protein